MDMAIQAETGFLDAGDIGNEARVRRKRLTVAQFQPRGKGTFTGGVVAGEGAGRRHRTLCGCHGTGCIAADLGAVVAGAQAHANHIAALAEPEFVGNLGKVQFQFGFSAAGAVICWPLCVVLTTSIMSYDLSKR